MQEDNFFSIDKLVEFGLGVSVADQMIRMMNSYMQQMYVPGADNSVFRSESVYFVILDGAQAGPFSACELTRMAAESLLTASTYVWKPGMMSWKPAADVPEVLRIIALTPPVFNSKK